MGVNKDTKIFYKHGDAEAFEGVGGTNSVSGSVAFTAYDGGENDSGNAGWKDADSFTYRNEANNADVTKSDYKDVLADVVAKHSGSTKNSWAEGVCPLETFSDVDDAKKKIFGPTILAGFDTHCDNQQWALVDGNKGLKHTRDWKVENDASKDGHYAQFKTAFDGKHAEGNDPYFQLGAFKIDDTGHLF